MTGILAATVLLWVTETLPLFATAFIAITLATIRPRDCRGALIIRTRDSPLAEPGWPWLS